MSSVRKYKSNLDNENAEIHKREDILPSNDINRTQSQFRKLPKFYMPKLKPIYQNGKFRKFDTISNIIKLFV